MKEESVSVAAFLWRQCATYELSQQRGSPQIHGANTRTEITAYSLNTFEALQFKLASARRRSGGKIG